MALIDLSPEYAEAVRAMVIQDTLDRLREKTSFIQAMAKLPLSNPGYPDIMARPTKQRTSYFVEELPYAIGGENASRNR